MKSIALFCVFLAFFGQLALALPKINVISPSSLSSHFDDKKTGESGIPFSIGNYGKIPYGVHIIGAISVANPVDACSAIKEFRAGEYSLDENVIVLIKAGGCSFTTKTRNAQAAGAKVVVIIQENDEPLPESFGVASETEALTIPTILVGKKHGENLIKYLEKLPFPPLNPSDIIPLVSVNFPYDTLTTSVKLDFWFSPSDSDISYNFLNYFSYYALSNPSIFKFTPHFVSWDCLICKNMDYSVELTGDCISGGRYCAPDPDEEGPLTGADILYEGLRQACIWKDNQQTWWEYTSYYANRCLADRDGKSDQDPEECSYQILNQVAGPNQVDRVKKCVEDSWVPIDGKVNRALSDNKIFAAEKDVQFQYDITEFPVLLINHKPLDEELVDVYPVMSEICSNIKNAPAQCENYLSGEKDYTRHHVGISLTMVVVLFMGALVLFYCYRRMTKRKLGQELSMEANNMVSRYMSLKDLSVGPTKEGEEETAV